MASSLRSFLVYLGLSDEEISLYETLTKHGTQTVLEVSRTSGVSRTQVYRVLASLKEKGLVEEVIDEYRKLVKASDAAQLEQLVRTKQHETKLLATLFPSVKEEIFASLGTSQPETKVQFYRGRSGLRQMVWHTLRAQKEVVGYTYRPIEEYVGHEFMRDWKETFERKRLIFREIYSDAYRKGINEGKKELHYSSHVFQDRYITKQVLDINIQMDIYNDVVAQYNWHEGEVFGVEIYNAKVTQFHKQLFEIIWNLAKKK